MNTQTIIRKTAQWLLRILAACLIFLGVALAAIYFFLQRDPDELARSYLSDISRRTGMEFSIGAIDVTLLPLPAIAISDFSIRGRNLDFNAAWLTAQPSFRELLRGNLAPGSITLMRPKLAMKTDYPVDDPISLGRHLAEIFKKEGQGGSEDADLKKLLRGGCGIEIRNGSARVLGSGGSALVATSLQCGLKLGRRGIRGDLRLGALRTARDSQAIFNLEDLRFSGEMNPLDISDSAPDFRASGQIRYRGYISRGVFDIDFASSSFNWNGHVAIQADLDLDGLIVPASLSGRAMKLEGGRQIVFRGLEWMLDGDSGSLDATLRLPGPSHPFSLDGTLLLHRASLAQWLGFARAMPPGLQLAMDNITKGRVEFSLDAKGLVASRVECSSSGARFTGSGSVASFARPVVFLDLRAKSVNLDLVLPEALGSTPEAPYFANAPLTPVDSRPLRPGETGLGYDIRLAADRIKYGPLSIGNGSLRIYEGKMDKSGLEDVLLDARGDFYGGKLEGHCILGADPSLPYSITASARDVNGALLYRALPALPISQGIFRANVNVSSKSKNLDAFLASLRGSVEVSGVRAGLAASGAKTVFSSLSCKAALRGARLETKRLIVDGQWSAEAREKAWSAEIGLNGGLFLGGAAGLQFTNVPGRLRFALHEPLAILPASTRGSLEGQISGKASESEFSVRDGRFEFLGIDGKINASLDGAKPAWKGDLSLATGELAGKLEILGLKAGQLPANLNKFDLKASFSGNPGLLRLSGINARLGNSAISGRLSWETRGGKPFFDFALAADRIDCSNFYDSARPDSKAGRWNFSAMRDFNAKGLIEARAFRGWDISLEELRMPLSLDDGKLVLGPVSARLYGGGFHSRGSALFRQGVSLDCVFSAHDFDLEAAARDRKLQQALKGRANLDASLRASLTGPGQLEKALNGEWSVSARNGSWQARDKKGAPQGRPTGFRLVSASGSVVNGLVKSGNIKLESPDLKLDGHGWLNLPARQIDCDFNVNMKGMPDFPLRVYGPLDKTQTSIGAGKMVINAIGGLAGSLVDALGGIVEGMWKIFR